MAIFLPDGAILSIATTYEATPRAFTVISNLAPPVVTSTAHGYANGDILEVRSGWNRINEGLYRIVGITANTFNLEGVDATSTVNFPAGAGLGTTRRITAFTQISQILEFSTTGGEQQFATFSLLEEDFERQLPSITSAQSVSMTIADDPSLAGYIALKAASDARALRALRLALRNGSVLLYNGIFSLNETPTLAKGSVMAVTASFSLQGRPTRYAA